MSADFYAPFKATAPVTTQRAPVEPLAADRATRYGAKALEGEIQKLMDAPVGTRNDTLNIASFNLGQLVEVGALQEQDVIEALANAANVIGLTAAEADATIHSGLRAGRQQPRQIQPQAPAAQVSASGLPILDVTAVHVVTDEPKITGAELLTRMIDGARFILDAPAEIPTVWGSTDDILWASGEALMIVGGNGVGKTTLASQVIKGRLGLQSTCLGLPVAAGAKRVLYLAMDRPAQVQRALARLFMEADREILADRLLFWKGPPPIDLAKAPSVLLEMCHDAGADTVVVDSLKDAAIGLSEDEVGAGWNRARQAALAAGVEVLELHHNVKRGANGGPPTSIADVYGSTWLTAGAGSVIFLHGEPGDPVVAFRHLKQPASEVGPWTVMHDHERGESTVSRGMDLVMFAKARGGVTARQAACALFDKDKPSEAELEKARRRLDGLVKAGRMTRFDGAGERGQAVYEAVAVAALPALNVGSVQPHGRPHGDETDTTP